MKLHHVIAYLLGNLGHAIISVVPTISVQILDREAIILKAQQKKDCLCLFNQGQHHQLSTNMQLKKYEPANYK